MIKSEPQHVQQVTCPFIRRGNATSAAQTRVMRPPLLQLTLSLKVNCVLVASNVPNSTNLASFEEGKQTTIHVTDS